MYLMGSLPPKQRVALQKQGLKTFNLVWAFHSEATEVCLNTYYIAPITHIRDENCINQGRSLNVETHVLVSFTIKYLLLL